MSENDEFDCESIIHLNTSSVPEDIIRFLSTLKYKEQFLYFEFHPDLVIKKSESFSCLASFREYLKTHSTNLPTLIFFGDDNSCEFVGMDYGFQFKLNTSRKFYVSGYFNYRK